MSTETKARGGLSEVLTQVMANNPIHFDTLAKRSPLSSEKYAVVLSVLIEEFENSFQSCKKNSLFFLFFVYLHAAFI